ncbi:MAG TPA: ferritin-like domain-containing protein, partial [Chloroflexota bacterium]|nr:ferritin-like domain-containing protein [Chloroflexota bacterium]
NNRYDVPDLEPSKLFAGNVNREPFTNFQFTGYFNIFEFPVSDRRTANAALDLVLKQGEGIAAQPGYSSHFCTFCDIYTELVAAPFDAAWPVMNNPNHLKVREEPARSLLAFFTDAYVTQLYMLTTFYSFFLPESHPDAPPTFPFPAPLTGLSAALQETAFAPMMTMVIRPVGEILTRLPAGDDGLFAGPSWFIPPADQDLTPHTDSTFFMGRFGRMSTVLAHLIASVHTPSAIKPRLTYIQQNVDRMQRNFLRIISA